MPPASVPLLEAGGQSSPTAHGWGGQSVRQTLVTTRPVIRQFLIFFINGGILGLLSWLLQIGIYKLIGMQSSISYAVATALACSPTIIVNCAIQRYLIFRHHGLLWHFLLSNLFVMLLVSLTSPVCRYFIDMVIGAPYGDQGGFVLAALLGSVPSFFINRFWVFATAK